MRVCGDCPSWPSLTLLQVKLNFRPEKNTEFVAESASLAHDDALPPSSATTMFVLRLATTFGAVRVAAALAFAVELDAGTRARDAVAFTGTTRRRRRHRAGRAAVAAA